MFKASKYEINLLTVARGSPRGIMAKVRDCGSDVKELELH